LLKSVIIYLLSDTNLNYFVSGQLDF